MIQKRTNPLEKKQMKPKTTAKTTTVKDVKTAEPEQLMPIQKRINPLTLEQVKAPVEKKVVPTKEKKVQIAVTEVKKPEPEKIYIPTEIVGKAKKSFAFAFVNKSLLNVLKEKTKKGAGQIFDDAMLTLVAYKYPEKFKAIEKILKEEGCEIK